MNVVVIKRGLVTRNSVPRWNNTSLRHRVRAHRRRRVRRAGRSSRCRVACSEQSAITIHDNQSFALSPLGTHAAAFSRRICSCTRSAGFEHREAIDTRRVFDMPDSRTPGLSRATISKLFWPPFARSISLFRPVKCTRAACDKVCALGYSMYENAWVIKFTGAARD